MKELEEYFDIKLENKKNFKRLKSFKNHDEKYGIFFKNKSLGQLLEIIKNLEGLSSVINLERFERMYAEDAHIYYKLYCDRKTKKFKEGAVEASLKGVLAIKKKMKQDPNFRKNFDTSSVEHFIKKGYTEEEAKQKSKDKQSTFSLKICIEKYGDIEGNKVFKERQNKWQKTLNDKSYQERIDIDKGKGNPYGSVGYDKARITNEENGNWIKTSELTEYKLYEIECRRNTEKLDLTSLENIELRGLEYNLDHKYSIFMGFMNKVPVEKIANIKNLEILEASLNREKAAKCSISLDEVLLF